MMTPDLAEPMPLSQLILIPSKQRQKMKCPPTCSSVKSGAVAGDWLILLPATPHFPLIPSNGFMPIIQERNGLRRAFLVSFQVSLHSRSALDTAVVLMELNFAPNN